MELGLLGCSYCLVLPERTLLLKFEQLLVVVGDGLLDVQKLSAPVAVEFGVLHLLAQQHHLLLKVGDVLLVHVPRALGGLPVFLFLDAGLLLFGQFMGGVVFGVGGSGFVLGDGFLLVEVVLVGFGVGSEFSEGLRLCLSSHVII
jgi:hypothetical protein